MVSRNPLLGAAGLVLVGAIGLAAAGIAYIGLRLVCRPVPAADTWSDMCEADSRWLAVAIGAGVAVVSLVGWLLHRRR